MATAAFRGASPTTAAPIHLESYVREVFDGVVADIDVPAQFTPAGSGARGADGFTNEQRPVYRAIEAAIVRRFRPLMSTERVQLEIAFALEWNRRAADQSRMSGVSFTTTDGRYFANDGDRRAYQKTLDDRAARDAQRRARVELETATSAQEVA